MPNPNLLSRPEMIETSDLLFLQALDLREQVRFQSSVGGLSFVIAAAGTTAAAFFPGAAVPIAIFSVLFGTIPILSAYEQQRRQTELDHVLDAISRLSWQLREQ